MFLSSRQNRLCEVSFQAGSIFLCFRIAIRLWFSDILQFYMKTFVFSRIEIFWPFMFSWFASWFLHKHQIFLVSVLENYVTDVILSIWYIFPVPPIQLTLKGNKTLITFFVYYYHMDNIICISSWLLSDLKFSSYKQIAVRFYLSLFELHGRRLLKAICFYPYV